MLAAVHGVFDRSISTWTWPRLVSKVRTWKPERGGSVGGRPTSLMPSGSGDGLSPGLGLGKSLCQVQFFAAALGLAVGLEPPVAATTIHTTAPITTSPATPAPM